MPTQAKRHRQRAVSMGMRGAGSTLTRLVCLALTGGAGVAGCSASEETLPGWQSTNSTADAPCQEGAPRACGITLSVTGSTASCYLGEQTCHAGEWSQCQNGQVSEKRLPG